MIALGYLYKRIATCPEWVGASHVRDIYSLSHCLSEPFADYVNHWKHNGYWLFDSPAIMGEIAGTSGISLDGTRLFYYEAHDLEFDEDGRCWTPFTPEPSFKLDIEMPERMTLQGFDVTSFSLGGMPECSPLSCNSLAETVATSAHCLLRSLDEAKALLERGTFDKSEPGPFRIIAVYTVD